MWVPLPNFIPYSPSPHFQPYGLFNWLEADYSFRGYLFSLHFCLSLFRQSWRSSKHLSSPFIMWKHISILFPLCSMVVRSFFYLRLLPNHSRHVSSSVCFTPFFLKLYKCLPAPRIGFFSSFLLVLGQRQHRIIFCQIRISLPLPCRAPAATSFFMGPRAVALHADPPSNFRLFYFSTPPRDPYPSLSVFGKILFLLPDKGRLFPSLMSPLRIFAAQSLTLRRSFPRISPIGFWEAFLFAACSSISPLFLLSRIQFSFLTSWSSILDDSTASILPPFRLLLQVKSVP